RAAARRMGARSRLARPVDDLEAPGLPGSEELVGVDLVRPADEVALGIILGRAVDGATAGIDRRGHVVAALERRLALLDRGSFAVPFPHVEKYDVIGAGSSVGRAGDF